MWSQLSAEQKNNYGEEYFERALRSLEKYTEKEADLGPTIRCLVDALCRTCPLPRKRQKKYIFKLSLNSDFYDLRFRLHSCFIKRKNPMLYCRSFPTLFL